MGEHISRAARSAKVATVLATGAIYKITGTSKIDFFASLEPVTLSLRSSKLASMMIHT